MDSVALALFRFFSRTRQNAGAAVRAPGAAPHPHPHPHECNYANNIVSARSVKPLRVLNQPPLTGVAPTKISVRWGRPREIQTPCRALVMESRFAAKLL